MKTIRFIRHAESAASYGNFKGNKAKAIWLPDEATATAWRQYLAQ